MSQSIDYYCQVLNYGSKKDVRTFTSGAKTKSKEKETFPMYNYLNVGDKI